MKQKYKISLTLCGNKYKVFTDGEELFINDIPFPDYVKNFTDAELVEFAKLGGKRKIIEDILTTHKTYGTETK